MAVAGGSNAGAQKSAMTCDAHQERGDERKKLDIAPRIARGLQKVASLAVAQRNVEVFAAAVDAGKRLFMQQELEMMAA